MSLFKNLLVASALLLPFNLFASAEEAIDSKEEKSGRRYCSLQPDTLPDLNPDMDPGRLGLIMVNRTKWVNGTTLRYYFFDKDTDGAFALNRRGQRVWRSWKGIKADEDVVRAAFTEWMGLGIGLKFEEVDDRRNAHIRIGFMHGDGSWSYLGREILGFGKNERTMNFGWMDHDTAVHEIGHTLGFPHEHQNPKAGIKWDEEAVYADLKRTNGWNREKTFHNIIRKIAPDSVQGSNWDPHSIMHYPFDPGLILEPEEYRQNGLTPTPGLSERDVKWVKTFYPALTADELALKPGSSLQLDLDNGESKSFTVAVEESGHYQIETFGVLDTVLVLFDSLDRKVAADDDSGQSYNARISAVLLAGAEYKLGLRLYYNDHSGDVGLRMIKL